MKKLILVFSLACFVAFGTLGVQKTFASANNIEIVKKSLDDDPSKTKKADGKDKKDAKATTTTTDKSKAACKDGDAKSGTKCETKKCCDSKAPAKECKEGDGGEKK